MSSNASDGRVTLPSFNEAFPESLLDSNSGRSEGVRCVADPASPTHNGASLGTPGGDQDDSFAPTSSATREHTHRERRYTCPQCDRRFSRPSGLATHMNSHTGDRPFACTFTGCGRRYTTLSNLRRHCQTHEVQFHTDESGPDPTRS